MNNFVMLPMWANMLFIAAVMSLIGLSVSKKVNLKVINLKLGVKSAYYVIAAIVIMAEAIAFFTMAPMQEVTGGYLGFMGAGLFFALLAAGLTCGESESEKVGIGLKIIGAVYGIYVVLITLIFSNVAYAAIWGGTLITFGFIGHILFSAKK